MIKKQAVERIRLDYPVHLYRDDLIEIESSIKNDLTAKEIKTSFGGYEASSIGEIPEDTLTAQELKIQASVPYFSIEITSYDARPSIWIGEYDVTRLGVATKIKNILQERSRKYSTWTYRAIKYLTYISATVSFWFIIDGGDRWKYVFGNKYYLLTFFILSFGVCSYTHFVPLKSKIEFLEKKKTKNFWIRNKDSISTGLIVAIPVAILSFLLGHFIK